MVSTVASEQGFRVCGDMGHAYSSGPLVRLASGLAAEVLKGALQEDGRLWYPQSPVIPHMRWAEQASSACTPDAAAVGVPVP